MNGMIQHQMPADEYHASTAVSNSMLSAMKRSPAHCYALHLDPQRPPNSATPAMKAGTLAHTMILEPASVPSRYIAKPADIGMRTKAGKEWLESVPLGVDIVTAEQMSVAEAQRSAVMAVPVLRDLLSSGVSEASIFWTDSDTGLVCRARPDWLQRSTPKTATVLDIKTIADLSPESVAKSIANYGYHRQQAHYSNGVESLGIKVDAFVFGFVSGSYPYLAAAYVLDEETAAQGQDEVAGLLMHYAECQRTGKWPAFGDTYNLIGLPAWARQSNEIEVSYG